MNCSVILHIQECRSNVFLRETFETVVKNDVIAMSLKSLIARNESSLFGKIFVNSFLQIVVRRLILNVNQLNN